MLPPPKATLHRYGLKLALKRTLHDPVVPYNASPRGKLRRPSLNQTVDGSFGEAQNPPGKSQKPNEARAQSGNEWADRN